MCVMKKAKDPAKIEKEIAKRQKQLNKREGKSYYFYLFFIIGIVYITDEVASAIASFMQQDIAKDIASLETLNKITFLSFPLMALGVIYKPLADRFGRKPFLILNTFGMCMGLMIVYLTHNLAGYIAGTVLTQFFITHDMQVVYIMESAPDKHRAKIYSSIKCVAMLGVTLIPLLRKTMMHSTSEWRNVFLVPALLGIAVSATAIFLAKETDAFNIARINELRGTAKDVEEKSSGGGIINALKFGFRHKQTKWLFLALVFCETGFIFTLDYQSIMTFGFVDNAMAQGLFTNIEAASESILMNEITTALFFYPIGCAISQLIPGFISDKKGRRYSAIAMSASAVVLFLGFWLGAEKGLPPQIVGFLCGGSVGTFWANIDTISLMEGESTPTELRSSMLSAIYLPLGLGIGFSFGMSFLFMQLFSEQAIGIISLCLTVPGLLADFFILSLKVKETAGVDLKEIDGSEYD